MANDEIPVGKLPTGLLARLVGRLGPLPPEVRLGPGIGEDACALDVPAGTLVVATDPITLTGRDLGRFSVVVNANDVAVTGARPRWFLATTLLPPGTGERDVEELFGGMQEALTAMGATLVGGHTEVTDAVGQPVVVGQMLGLAEPGRTLATAGARAGDVIVQVGTVPVEGAAVLAAEAVERLDGVEAETLRAAAASLDDPGISVVDAALAAADLGATAMHDPTEGGLAAGLHELAVAAGVGVRVDPAAILWHEPGVALCRAVGADPWATLASGALLAAFGPADADAAVEALRSRGHPAAVIGIGEDGSGVRDLDGRPLAWPERDEVARVLADGPG